MKRSLCIAGVVFASIFLLSACGGGSDTAYTPPDYRVYPADCGPTLQEALAEANTVMEQAKYAVQTELKNSQWVEASSHSYKPRVCATGGRAPEGYVQERTSTWMLRSNAYVPWETTEAALRKEMRRFGFEAYAGPKSSNDTPYIVYYGASGEQLTMTKLYDAVQLDLLTGCYRRGGDR